MVQISETSGKFGQFRDAAGEARTVPGAARSERVRGEIKEHSMKRAAALVLTAFVGLAASAQPLKVALEPKPNKHVITRPAHDGPVIQLVICLDTSGSMEGLINQARTRLWNVISTLDTARMNGQRPRLEVAIMQYGSTHQSSAEGFMGIVLPFTSDLDRISEVLYSLQIAGSAEYCGMAVERATYELDWLPTGEGVMKVIMIAGNEEFTQGGVNFRTSVPTAVEYGITVNTVHCGDDVAGRNGGWAEAAKLGRGEYNIIDQNKKIRYIRCPQDDRINELNVELNGTYLYYGAMGQDSRSRQLAQDSLNDKATPEAGVSRIAAKAKESYSNSHWDLVDASEGADFDYGEIEPETLPAELQELTPEELEERVEQERARRAEIQSEIQKLVKERNAWREAELKRLGEASEEGLDTALAAALVSQAKDAGFTFEK